MGASILGVGVGTMVNMYVLVFVPSLVPVTSILFTLTNMLHHLHVTDLFQPVLPTALLKAMPCDVMSVILHVKDPQLFVIRVGHHGMLAGN